MPRKHLREELAATVHNQLAGSLLRQGRLDAGGGTPLKQEVYAKQLATSLHLNGLARQTLSAWERATTVVPASSLSAFRTFATCSSVVPPMPSGFARGFFNLP